MKMSHSERNHISGNNESTKMADHTLKITGQWTRAIFYDFCFINKHGYIQVTYVNAANSKSKDDFKVFNHSSLFRTGLYRD